VPTNLNDLYILFMLLDLDLNRLGLNDVVAAGFLVEAALHALVGNFLASVYGLAE
jgi:hypothetical protein